MKNMIIGCIGIGNMGYAFISGICRSSLIPAENLIIGGRNEERLEHIQEQFGVRATTKNTVVAKTADILILAVKPQQYKDIIHEIKDSVKEHTIIISIAAGIEIASIERWFGKPMHIARAMPNTPSFINEGISAISFSELLSLSTENQQYILDIFACLGKIEIVEENMMNLVTALSGSSPAYAFLFIEAMVATAVSEGMERKQAIRFAAQSIMGAAKMCMETKESPEQLKQNVCSPGGSTIEALKVFEAHHFSDIVREAMLACRNRAKELNIKD